MRVNLVKLVNVFQCNVFIFENKRRTGYDKYCKIKLLSSAILHGVSNEPEAYLEPCQTSKREPFCKNGSWLQVAKKLFS